MGNYNSGFICYGFDLDLSYDQLPFDDCGDLPEGLQIRAVGVGDDASYILFIEKTLIRESCTSMKFVPEELVAHEDWDKLLVDFAKKYNLNANKPSWLICSYYG